MDKSDEKNRNVVNGYDIATNAKGSQSTKYTCGKDGSTGGGFADNEEELRPLVKNALKLSPVNETLIEKSIKGLY